MNSLLRIYCACSFLLAWSLSTENVVADQTAVILSEEGQLSLKSNILIAAPLAGGVAAVAVREGDTVTAGDPLVQLDATIAQSEMIAAEAAYNASLLSSQNDVELEYAAMSLEVRRRELQQSEQANQQYIGSVTETEIAKLTLLADQSRLSIQQAQQDRRIAQATADEKAAIRRIAETRLEKHRITAPAAGIVAEVAVEAGEWVDPGTPVLRLIALHPIRVECFVDGHVFGPDLVGKPVRFQWIGSAPTAAESKTYTGRVVFVSSELHPVTGQAKLWAELENAELELRSGMRGRIDVLNE